MEDHEKVQMEQLQISQQQKPSQEEQSIPLDSEKQQMKQVSKEQNQEEEEEEEEEEKNRVDDEIQQRKPKQEYKLHRERSILDLEREVIQSLMSSSAVDDSPTLGNTHAHESFSFSPTSATIRTMAKDTSSGAQQTYRPPAWDDITFQNMLSSDSAHEASSSGYPLGPTVPIRRTNSSTAELSSLAKLTKSGARQSAPPTGWHIPSSSTLNSTTMTMNTMVRQQQQQGKYRDSRKNPVRQSAPAPGWSATTTTIMNPNSIWNQPTTDEGVGGKLDTFRTGNVESSLHSNSSGNGGVREGTTVPSVRGVMASFRQFLSTADNSNNNNNNNNNNSNHTPTRIDVTPYFPHMFRPREQEEEEDDENKNLTRLRLVKRNLPHFQSKNQVSIQQRSKVRLVRSHTAPPDTNPFLNRYVYQWLPSEWLPSHFALFQRDLFHILLRWPTAVSILFWSISFTIFVILFALIYLAASKSSSKDVCNLAAGFEFDFTAAFGFSLLTATTVGYTLPGGTNAFFENCPGIQIAIYSQIIFNLILDGLLVTFLYTRISRAELRSSQVLFGNKALLRPIQYDDSCGRKITRWTLELRVFDADAAHPICEAHVRIYASILGQNQQLQVCRLLRPDDSLNGFLFTSIPYSIIHEIDFFSPLVPSSIRKMYKEHGQWLIGWNGLERRESDARNQTSYGWVCPVCATTCGEMGRLISHIKYMKLQDQNSGIPVEDSHQRIPDAMLDLSHVSVMQSMDVNALKKHLQNVEIICVVEGIDPIASGSFQALQSYTIDDLVFGGSFMPCVRLEAGEFVVDLDKFHRILRPGYLVTNQMKDL